MSDFNKDSDFIDPADNRVTLTDEVTGEDVEFELVARCELEGNTYFAFSAIDGKDDEYVILKRISVDEDIMFETIEDDDEFEMVEDYFNDLLFGEVDYDED